MVSKIYSEFIATESWKTAVLNYSRMALPYRSAGAIRWNVPKTPATKEFAQQVVDELVQKRYPSYEPEG